MPRIDVHDAAHVRTVRIVHPEKKGALTRAMLSELAQALSSLPQSVRAVILAGEGGVFSSGFDTRELDDKERSRGVNPIEAAAYAIARAPVPVVAALSGICFGGAVEIARSATFVIAHPATKICIPAVRLGLMYPASGLARLSLAAPRTARRLLLSGDIIDGDAAFRLDFCDELSGVPEETATALAVRIAAGAPLAVSGMKRALDALRARPGLSNAEKAPVETPELSHHRDLVLRSADLVEGLNAAREKRNPEFTGH